MINEKALNWAKIYVNDPDEERRKLAAASLKKNFPGAFGDLELEPHTAALVDTLQRDKVAPEFDIEEK